MAIFSTTSASRRDDDTIGFWGRYRRFILPALVLVAVLSAWEYVCLSGKVSKLILAAPSAIFLALFSSGGEIMANTLVTLFQALSGFAIGNCLGLLIAIAFVYSSTLRRTVYPIAIGIEAVPIVAVVPVLILWLGNGYAPKIFITAVLSFFPMLVNGYRGLKSADAEVKELLFTLSASPLQVLTIVRLPAAVPFIFNALKLSSGACIIASIVAEWLASDHGLGFLIILYGARYQIPEVWATAVVATVVSLMIYGIVSAAENWALPWKARAEH